MSAVSPGTDITYTPPTTMDQSNISSYSQQHPANVQALQVFKSIIKSCYGPFGRLKMIQNQCGGHVTITSSCKRLLSLLSLSKPILKLICAALEGHLRVFSDGGLYTALLICSLVEGCWESGLHPALCIAVNDIILDICLKAMSSVCRVPINIAAMETLLSLVKSVIRSKPACGMVEREIRIISSLVVQSFISSMPNGDREGQVTIPRVQVVGVESQGVSESHIVQGVLLDAPDIPAFFIKEMSAPRLESGPKQGCLRVVLYNISLAGDSEEYAHARYELGAGVEGQDGTVAAMRTLVGHLLDLKVGLVACQKVVHPSIKQCLRQRGVLVADRISLLHIEAVQLLTGATILSTLDQLVPESSLGHLTDVRHHVMFGKSYLHLSNQSSSLCTLVLCNTTEQALEELKHVCHVAHHTLGLTLRDPTALPGAGCLEFILAHHVRKQAKELAKEMLQHIGCTNTQFLHLVEKFTSCLEAVAMAIDNGCQVTDSHSHHRWHLPQGSMSDSDWPERLGGCGCGMTLASEPRGSEWTVAGKLMCGVHRMETAGEMSPDTRRTPDQSCDTLETSETSKRASSPQSSPDITPAVHDGIPIDLNLDRRSAGEKEKREVVMDLFAVKCNAFRVAVETANLVLRIGHTVEDIN